jgi:uncharacterized protein
MQRNDAPPAMTRHAGTFDLRTVRAQTNPTDPIGFAGHAAMWNHRTWIGGKQWGFWEELAPGCCTRSLSESTSKRMLLNHNSDMLLATTAAASLRLTEDLVGLAVDADMAPTSYAHDLAILLERKEVRGMSFGFSDDAWEYSVIEAGASLYRLTEITLYEVSPCGDPAYTSTDAALRSLNTFVDARSARNAFDTGALSLARHEIEALERATKTLHRHEQDTDLQRKLDAAWLELHRPERY